MFRTIEIAIDKVWTAASFGLPTHQWNELLRDHQQLAQYAHRPRLVAVAGGYPLLLGGQVIGGIGVSGGRHLQDRQINEGAIRAAGLELPQHHALPEQSE